VLSETAVLAYKCDNYYNPQSESGIIYNDPDLNIDWRIGEAEALLSEKDLKNVAFREARIDF
jgi:dTDP-4-dehydrorhamnose 3,5-epimerase